LNANIEELDVGFIQSPSTSILQCSSSRGLLPFDLHDELVMEDDEQVGEIMQQSNSNISKYRLYYTLTILLIFIIFVPSVFDLLNLLLLIYYFISSKFFITFVFL
jgi:hypothetical protein